MKKVSVVILNWNGKRLLEQFLPSVLKYTDSSIADIIVADNASTDDSIEFLEEYYPSISIIRLPSNYGYADGYNNALREVTSDYYILLNSDVEVTANWLAPIISYMDEHDDVVAAQPKILSQRNKAYFEYAGACGGFIDKYGYPFCRGRIFGVLEKDNAQYDNIIDIFWASGACLVVRSKDYFEDGGLDGSFFAHMEEIDLCWRFNARGKRIVCIPQSTVYHVGGGTLDAESPRKTYLNFRNNLLMLYKNLPDLDFNSIFYTRLLLDYLATIKFILTGKFKNAASIINAHKEFQKIRSTYNSSREDNFKKQVSNPIKTIYSKSILSDFYLKRKKYFSQITSLK